MVHQCIICLIKSNFFVQLFFRLRFAGFFFEKPQSAKRPLRIQLQLFDLERIRKQKQKQMQPLKGRYRKSVHFIRRNVFPVFSSRNRLNSSTVPPVRVRLSKGCANRFLQPVCHLAKVLRPEQGKRVRLCYHNRNKVYVKSSFLPEIVTLTMYAALSRYHVSLAFTR